MSGPRDDGVDTSRREVDALEAEQRALAGELQMKLTGTDGSEQTDEALTITVVGEFNSGKSTLINALLGESLLPMGITPTTATINVVEHGEAPSASVTYVDGRTTALLPDRESLAEFRATKGEFQDVRHLLIRSPKVPPGCRIVDTPGVNDICESRMEVVYGFLPASDVIVFVMDLQQALKKSEVEFLRDRVLGRSLARTIFVLNHADRVPPRDAEALKEEVTAQIRGLYEHVARTFDASGGELLARQIRSASEGIRVCVLSAKAALRETGPAEHAGLADFRDQIAQLAGGSTAARVRLRKRLGVLGMRLREMEARVDSFDAAVSGSESAFRGRTESLAVQLEESAAKADQVSRKLRDGLAQMKSASCQRILVAVEGVQASTMGRLRPDGSPDTARAEADIRRAAEAELETLQKELTALAGQSATLLHTPVRISLDIPGPTGSEQWTGFGPMDMLMMGAAEILGLVVFGPLGLLAGPLLGFVQVSQQRESATAQFAAAFRSVAGKISSEIARALDGAGTEILAASSGALIQVLVVAKATLDSRTGAPRGVDTGLVREQLRALEGRLEALAAEVT